MTYNFGNIDKLLLLGGGPIMVSLLQTSIPIDIVVFTANRFLDESFSNENKSFRNFLDDRDIEYYVSDNINSDSSVDQFITSNTLGLSISAPWIIKQGFIDKFVDGKLVNIHVSLLPEYRGGGGPSWKILNKEVKGGFSIHFITTGIDDGDILLMQSYLYPENHLFPRDRDSLDTAQCVEGLEMFLSKVFSNEDFTLTKQDENRSIYLPRLNTKVQAFIDWDWSREEIVSFVNAFSFPHEGAKSFSNRTLYKVRSISLGVNRYFHPFLKGLIIRMQDGIIAIAHTEGEILIHDLVNEFDESCKNDIRLGDRFVTNRDHLDNALTYRAVYNANGLKANKKD